MAFVFSDWYFWYSECPSPCLRPGRMLLNDSKKGPPHVQYRRPYGCAVLAMSDVFHTITDLKEEKDFVLKVYTWVNMRHFLPSIGGLKGQFMQKRKIHIFPLSLSVIHPSRQFELKGFEDVCLLLNIYWTEYLINSASVLLSRNHDPVSQDNPQTYSVQKEVSIYSWMKN